MLSIGKAHREPVSFYGLTTAFVLWQRKPARERRRSIGKIGYVQFMPSRAAGAPWPLFLERATNTAP